MSSENSGPATSIRIATPCSVQDRQEVEKLVDDKIREFNNWFQDKGNEPLVHGEKAIIKTFLYFMLYGEEDGEKAGS